jgi:hypothetical protein
MCFVDCLLRYRSECDSNKVSYPKHKELEEVCTSRANGVIGRTTQQEMTHWIADSMLDDGSDRLYNTHHMHTPTTPTFLYPIKWIR